VKPSFFPRAGGHAGLLQQRLPPCPSPGCRQCGAAMHDVRPYTVESATLNTFKIPCLVQCPNCGAAHIGHRTLIRKRNALQFGSQEFELYVPEKHAPLLTPVKEGLEARPERYQKIVSRP